MLGLRPSFSQWADPWSRLGLWLSLWDESGECIDHAGGGCPFWNALMQWSPRFRQRLKAMARRGLRNPPAVAEIEPQCGFHLIALPVTQRQHRVGTLLACALGATLDEEGFARFCDHHEVDRVVLRGLLEGVPQLSGVVLQSYCDILGQHLQSYATGTTARRDVNNLSSHLAQAYEELSLIYRVSSNLTVLKGPVEHFEALCQELLDSTVVASFAVVLEAAEGDSTAAPTVVRAGPLEASADDIVRLYRQARDRGRNVGAALVVNSPGGDPSFAWAAGWLKQFVFFDLSSNDHVFGGLLALNHVDGEDFGSEEAQLINAVAERSSAFLENVRLYENLERLFMGMLHALVSSIDAKDPYTCGHSQRVAWFSRHIACLSGLPQAQSQRIYLSGLLHDIGKIGVSEGVLRKAGRLTPEEFREMRQHPVIGARILENVPQVQDVIPGVLHHHERYDGKGYPLRLAGEDIPLIGRIIGLADSFDAMTTSRTYRHACPTEMAEAEIRRCSATQFDPQLVDLVLGGGLREMARQMHESDKQPTVRPLLYSTDGGAGTLS